MNSHKKVQTLKTEFIITAAMLLEKVHHNENFSISRHEFLKISGHLEKGCGIHFKEYNWAIISKNVRN